jgi:predicted RNase H-like nuclease (RuvC/YqgF family)
MKLDHFNNLSDDEKAAYLLSCEALETTNKDQEAEISSLKKENETFKAGSEKLEKDLKEAKELNFTLARSIDTSNNRPTFEDTLHDIFYKKGENKA